jgi:hypothetical protein
MRTLSTSGAQVSKVLIRGSIWGDGVISQKRTFAESAEFSLSGRRVYQALGPLAGGKPGYQQLSGRTDSFRWLVRIAF